MRRAVTSTKAALDAIRLFSNSHMAIRAQQPLDFKCRLGGSEAS